MTRLKQMSLSYSRLIALAISLSSVACLSAHAAPTVDPSANQAQVASPDTAHASQRCYAVQSGQSLHDVVVDLTRAEEDITPAEQAALRSALVKANPHAFIAGNLNQLKKGAILIVPTDLVSANASISTASILKPAPSLTAEQAIEAPEAASAASADNPPPPVEASKPLLPALPVSPVASSSFSVPPFLSSFLKKLPWSITLTPALVLMLGLIFLAVVALVLVLSMVLIRRARTRSIKHRANNAEPTMAGTAKVAQDKPEPIDQMVADVKSWLNRHPPQLTSPFPAAPHQNQQARADARSEVGHHATAPAASTLPADEQQKTQDEINKLGKAIGRIDLGDWAGARELINQVAASIEENLRAASARAAAQAEAENIAKLKASATAHIEQEIMAAPSLSAAESDHLQGLEQADFALDANLDMPDAVDLTPDEQERIRIERNKLELAKMYIGELGDFEGARELIDEVSKSQDARLRAEAQQILAKLLTRKNA